MAVLVVLALVLAAAAPPPPSIEVAVSGDQEVRVILVGPPAETPAGAFRGTLTVNGSPTTVRVSGTATRDGPAWRLPLTLRYADVPTDWAQRYRPDGFAFRVAGTLAGAPRDWSGSRSWKDVSVESEGETLEEFLFLEGVELESMSLLSSEARADLRITNPFSFELRIAEASYALSANGREVGSGGTRGLILHPRQKNRLRLPIELDHGELLGAAGSALLSGGEVTARLRGKLVLRLKGGDVVVPLDLSGNLSDSE